ncbi:TIGR02679 family protein [Gracilibacillus dipsosauri]|uniref:TIGR02679 family protein n=1 Tax=Gracilibacillus dipsosauri TaxID=178340 RepID=UPI00240927AD
MIEEALVYFREDDAFKHLFSLFKKKYESLGRIGGSVSLQSFTSRELEEIARFYGITTDQLEIKGKLTLLSFEKQLKQTRFSDLTLQGLLEAYYNENLLSNKEKALQRRQLHNNLLYQLANQYPVLEEWFTYLLERHSDSHWIYRLMDEGEYAFQEMVAVIAKAITNLPAPYERLPLFSQRITHHPHTFDLDTNVGKLLIHVLAVHKAKDVVIPTDSESINELLLSYKIMRDDITNYVTCVNLLAETDQGIHPLWQSASATNSVLNMPLRELLQVNKMYPASGKQVFIVENSGVYSSLLDVVPATPLICTHGQFKLASLVLVDLLVASDVTLYYAGDLDPEGLRMAERLVNRHRNAIKLWRMDLSAYKQSITEGEELSNVRLQKLNPITLPELVQVKMEIEKQKLAGYQEALIDEMIVDLERYK